MDGEPYGGKTLITELNNGPEIALRDEEGEAADSDQEEVTNQIFNVREAVPPTDYEAPYSLMPSNVVLKRVKEKVKNSYIKMAKQKAKEINDKKKEKPETTIASKKKKSTNRGFDEGKLPPIGTSNKVVVHEDSLLREKKEHWLNLLDLEHADAVISDAFWYVICKVCNPKPQFE